MDYADDDDLVGPYDDEDRDERDIALGRCRECETWGEFQCRKHADIHLEHARAEHEGFCLSVAARRGKRTKAGRKARRRLSMRRGAW